MRILSPDSSKGFSLIEMLVVISIVLLLSGLTLGALRASRTHQVINQAAYRLVMLIELAQGMAVSLNEPVYLVIADLKSKPDGVPMRAYTFIKDLEDPQLLHHWQFLPKDVVFAEDKNAPDVDLISADAIPGIEIGEVQDSIVEGQIRVLVEMLPDGSFRSGEPLTHQNASILLERGDWLADSKYYSKKDLEQYRILIRPRTGVLVVEEVFP